MIRSSHFAGVLILGLAGGVPAFSSCPISSGATVVVRAPVGDLQVQTTGRDAAEATVEGAAMPVQETCGKDSVEFTAAAPSDIRGPIVWKIVTPGAVDLDLVTMAGNITVGDVSGDVILRTAGGSVTTGNITGTAAIITQGGFIQAGNIGNDAELRSQGGTLTVGDIGGNAILHATAGLIRAGSIRGKVNAESGRTISISKAGEVDARSNAGDISIGDAARIHANSGGGSITSRRVRGPFQGHTESGDIKLDSAASSVEASTRQGNIIVRLMPDNYDGDLHMDLESGNGDVTVYLPPRMRASINASIQRAAFRGQQIISEFPLVPARPPEGFVPNRFYMATHSESVLNGGGNKIVLHTALGKITIRKN